MMSIQKDTKTLSDLTVAVTLIREILQHLQHCDAEHNVQNHTTEFVKQLIHQYEARIDKTAIVDDGELKVSMGKTWLILRYQHCEIVPPLV